MVHSLGIFLPFGPPAGDRAVRSGINIAECIGVSSLFPLFTERIASNPRLCVS